jgi:phage shock protein PspC (stress-responsive transcriptional regulator)
MNETTDTGSPGAGPEASGRAALSELRRSTDDRLVAGVCAGLGRHFDIDPVVFRVLFAVLTVFSSGVWLVVYAALWLIIPEAGSSESIARRDYGTQMDRVKGKINTIDLRSRTTLLVLGALAVLTLVLGPVILWMLYWTVVPVTAVFMVIAAIREHRKRRGQNPTAPAPWWRSTPSAAVDPQAPGRVSVTKQTPPTGDPGQA